MTTSPPIRKLAHNGSLLGAFYFGEHGPVWTTSRTNALKKVEKHAALINRGVEQRDAAIVPTYLRPALTTIGHAVYGAPARYPMYTYHANLTPWNSGEIA